MSDIDSVIFIIIYNLFMKLQDMKQLLNTVDNAKNTNLYDYNKMMSDFEVETRYEDRLKKLKNKWKNENKKHRETVELMKERREERYNEKRAKLMNELDKKNLNIRKKLNENRAIKEAELNKNIEELLEKEKRAKTKYKTRLIKEEKERLKNEQETFLKRKKIILI